MGRTGQDVKQLGRLIARRPIEQSIWKDHVCYWYAKGEPVSVALERATGAVQRDHPGFEPTYDPAILEL
jgi:hypothetical protein